MKKVIRLIVILWFFLANNINSFSQTSRIVSLAPSITDMLYLLKSNNLLVGCTTYCEIIENDQIEIVASVTEVNVEKIFILKPDLVITTSITKPTTIASIEKLGIKVMVLPTPKSYQEICNQLLEIAMVVNRQDIANQIIDNQKERLKILQQTIPNSLRPKLFFVIGTKPLFTVIPNTFMDDYITFSGGINIASDLKIGTISRETVVTRNPDMIIIVTMGIVGDQEKSVWENYSTISAAQKGKVFVIDSHKACSPNPVTFVDVTEQLISLIYK